MHISGFDSEVPDIQTAENEIPKAESKIAEKPKPNLNDDKADTEW